MQELLTVFDFDRVSEGFSSTSLPSVQIFKTSTYHARMPFFYDQGMIFVLQGRENVYWRGVKYCYDPEQYLVLNVSLPAECESFGSEQEPVIALVIDIDMLVVNQLLTQLAEAQNSRLSPSDFENTSMLTNCDNAGLVVSSITPALRLTLARLLHALQHPLEVAVLGEALLREVHYHVLRSQNYVNLLSLSQTATQVGKVERALAHIHRAFDQKMDVEQLAALVNMSITTFHRSFKQVTDCSPVQYLKKVRLTQAKKLLVEQRLQVKVVADQVGYESVSQFSREFSRYFGQPPSTF